DAGCQLSFLAVAVLTWGTRGWGKDPADPLDRMLAESRPVWQRLGRWLLKEMMLGYAITPVLWAALPPLVAAHFHLIQPAGIPLGPFATVLTSLALLTGFALLLFAPVLGPLAGVFAWLTGLLLSWCDALIELGVAARGSYWYVADVPLWW